MYFEDEKENMTGEDLNDLDLDLDADDKSITWDDLLNDDDDLDLSHAKKTGDVALDGDDLDVLNDDDDLVDDELVAPVKPTGAQRTKHTDAFDVFGGSDGSANDEDDELIQKDGLRDAGDAITPDLTQGRKSARQNAAAGSEDDDDIYFEASSAKKSSGMLPVLIGILVAVAFVGIVAYLFLTYGKSVSGADIANMLNPNASVQQDIGGDLNTGAVDPNDPAAAFSIDSEKKLEEAQKETKDKEKAEAEKDAKKFVTLAVQNAGRVNPFVPPAGFDASKVSEVKFADYELLSPPSEFPDDEVAQSFQKLMKITVSGILYDNSKPSAIINMNGADYFVQIGDMIDDYQIVGITRQYVAIKDGTNIYKAQVGESFKGDVDGMSTRNSSGARVYTSPKDVVVNVKEER